MCILEKNEVNIISIDYKSPHIYDRICFTMMMMYIWRNDSIMTLKHSHVMLSEIHIKTNCTLTKGSIHILHILHVSPPVSIETDGMDIVKCDCTCVFVF